MPTHALLLPASVVHPRSASLAAGLLKPELAPLVVVIAHLIHGFRFVEPAVQHDVSDGFGVFDVVQGVAVQHDQVGEFADSERTDFLVEAQVFRAVERGAAQGLEVGHSALLQHPEFPVCAEAVELAVCAEVDVHTGVLEFFTTLTDEDMAVLIFLLGRHRAVAAAFVEDMLRSKIQERLFLPHLRILVPVILAVETAVVDNQGRSVVGAGLAPQGHYVIV